MKYHVTYGLLLPSWVNFTVYAFILFLLLMCILWLFDDGSNKFVTRRKYHILALGWAFFLYSLISGVMHDYHAEVYVYAGDDGANISYDGHKIHLDPGGDVILRKDIYLPGEKNKGVELKCISKNGKMYSSSLVPGLYILEASGKRILKWREFPYQGKYEPRTDYIPEGSARGELRKISDYTYDVLYGVNEKPRDTIHVEIGAKIRPRYFSVALMDPAKDQDVAAKDAN